MKSYMQHTKEPKAAVYWPSDPQLSDASPVRSSTACQAQPRVCHLTSIVPALPPAAAIARCLRQIDPQSGRGVEPLLYPPVPESQTRLCPSKCRVKSSQSPQMRSTQVHTDSLRHWNRRGRKVLRMAPSLRFVQPFLWPLHYRGNSWVDGGRSQAHRFSHQSYAEMKSRIEQGNGGELGLNEVWKAPVNALWRTATGTQTHSMPKATHKLNEN